MGRFDSSNNPMFNEDKIRAEASTMSHQVDAYMTKEGAINKSSILFGIMALAAMFGYAYGNMTLVIVGFIGGLVTYFVTMWKPALAPKTALAYAGFEGLLVGGISLIYGGAYDGIVFQAISITVCILLVMLILYRSGAIKVTQKLRSGIMAATGSIMLVYILSWVLGMFGINIPFLHTGGAIGIGISVVIIGVAAFNLLLDFDFIEKGDKMNLPKYMEWYAGMGLIATLVWIYIEVIRLLSILGRD